MLKKWLRSPIVTGVLFVIAAGLILFGGIRGVQAAPRIQSEWFGAQVELDDIDVALTEQCGGEDSPRLVHGAGNLMKEENFLPEGEKFKPGMAYTERLAVRNTQNAENNQGGSDGNRIIKEYVRVTVYKYWTKTDKKTGKVSKAPELDPAKIKINFVTDGGWTIDSESTTAERTVLYYANILEPQQDSTEFTDTVTVDGSVLDDSAYKNATFHIEAIVDAVQTHNGKDAMMSAWGKNNMITVGADAEE